MIQEHAADMPDTNEEMLLGYTGEGELVRYDLIIRKTLAVVWLSSRENEQGEPAVIRIPEEHTQIFDIAEGFTAAGKEYQSLAELTVREDETGALCEDIYGRLVICMAERFPCFDSEDYRYEKRHYHWWFLQTGDSLTRVYHSDGSKQIYVTEDVQNLEADRWRDFQKLFPDKPEA